MAVNPVGRSSHVAIIGAGPSGIAAAVCLQKKEISFSIFEKGPHAFHAWRSIDPEVDLLSPTRLTLLPGMLHLRGERSYQTFRTFTSKLEEYARFNNIPVQPNLEVMRASPRENGFTVTVKKKRGSTETRDVTHIINATGLLSFPRLPEGFARERCHIGWKHSIDVRRKDLESARHLLVVGSRISAGEILDRWMVLRSPDARAWISAKSGFVHLRPSILGLDLHYVGWFPEHIPSQWFGRSLGIYHEPMISKSFAAGIKAGMIKKVSAIKSFNRRDVTLESGEEISPDLIVFATGYRYSLDHLKELFDFDSNGNPAISRCESTKVNNVFLLGFRFGRTFASPYIRGIARDSGFIARTIGRRLQAFS